MAGGGGESDDAGHGPGAVRIRNIDLHDLPHEKIREYFNSHKDFTGLHATTSCFSVWKDHGTTNGYGKVIPAVRKDGPYGNAHIFFFDDNIDFSGPCDATSSGICNLRDVETGAFVPFCSGQNGFSEALYGEHTVVHASTEYNVVLVKVNILDAMVNPNFFTEVVNKYSRPEEKVIAYVDINCTVVFSDVMTGKDKFSVLLSTMFEWIELRPHKNHEFQWGEYPPVKIKEGSVWTLKKLVKKALDAEGYNHFFSYDNCDTLLRQTMTMGSVVWSSGQDVTLEDFRRNYDHYGVVMAEHVADTGIVSSWYTMAQRACTDLKDRKSVDTASQGPHLVMINTFGVDSRKLILATLDSEEAVTLTTVNYEKWSIRDMKRYEAQYALGHY